MPRTTLQRRASGYPARRAVLHLPAVQGTLARHRRPRGFSTQAPACRHCGFGFLFELLDDYYPAPDTGLLVTDQERRVLAIGRGVFELTGLPEPI